MHGQRAQHLFASEQLLQVDLLMALQLGSSLVQRQHLLLQALLCSPEFCSFLKDVRPAPGRHSLDLVDMEVL